MHAPLHTRGRELGGDLAQQFVVEAPAVLAHRLQHPAAGQLVEDLVHLAPVQVDHRPEQLTVDEPAGQRRGLDHHAGFRAGPHPRDQGLVQGVGHLCRGGVDGLLLDLGHHLLDVERNPVAPLPHLLAGPVTQLRMQRADQLVGLVVVERSQRHGLRGAGQRRHLAVGDQRQDVPVRLAQQASTTATVSSSYQWRSSNTISPGPAPTQASR